MQTSADRNLDHIYQPLRDIVEQHLLPELQTWCDVHLPGAKPIVVEGLRSAEYQHSLWLQGRNGNPGSIVTEDDGYIHLSKHQSGLAVDIVPEKDGELLWNANEFFSYLGHLDRCNDLTWGGSWATLKDVDHTQWNTADTTTYAAAREWLKSEGLL
jgi:hypothetical protein